MQGRTVSPAEKLLHDRIAALGCIACRQEGYLNPHVSIHHVHGRTQEGCHMHVLPLCEPHHQDNGTALAVHPWKKRWQEKYGNQDELVAQQWADLGVPYTRFPARKRSSATSKRKGISAIKKPDSLRQVRSRLPVKKPTAAQVLRISEAKIQSAAYAKVLRGRAKEIKAECVAAYLAANKEAIGERKEAERLRRKQFRQDCKIAQTQKKRQVDQM